MATKVVEKRFIIFSVTETSEISILYDIVHENALLKRFIDIFVVIHTSIHL